MMYLFETQAFRDEDCKRNFFSWMGEPSTVELVTIAREINDIGKNEKEMNVTRICVLAGVFMVVYIATGEETKRNATVMSALQYFDDEVMEFILAETIEGDPIRAFLINTWNSIKRSVSMYEPHSRDGAVKEAIRDYHGDTARLLETGAPVAFWCIADMTADAIKAGHKSTVSILNEIYLRMKDKRHEDRELSMDDIAVDEFFKNDVKKYIDTFITKRE